ncbi:MAG: hypothetical protein ACO3UU_01230 [Minisyncoccia bacterium]
MINKESLEKKISNLLQRRVSFSVNNKITRSGKLIIFDVKDFYINFTIDTNNKDYKTYELPYPFSVNIGKDYVEFDYTLDTLASGNKMLYYKLKALNRVKKNKIFNNKVIIQYDI